MKKNEFQSIADRALSELVWDEPKRRKVLSAIDKEEKPVKKSSTTLILIAAILCISVTAFAAGLLFSPEYEAAKTAANALQAQYGLTEELLSLFSRSVEKEPNGTFTVRYTAPQADFPSEQMGEYTVLISGKQATPMWSNDGKSVSGGLEAEAFGAEQLGMLAFDYAGTMQRLTSSGSLAPAPTPNPRLAQESIVWTEEDQAEADRAVMESEEAEQLRLAEIAKAEASGRFSLQQAAEIAMAAVIQEYQLNESQHGALTHEPDST